MISVGVNTPKTPVTEGSGDVTAATLPNVCKMPGPPAPFVPTPLPNIGKSSDRLSEATSTVKIEDKKVAIKGSYYMSQPSPDVASQGTGGGIVSSTTQGKTEFIAPGSMNVKAEGKNIQLLGDAMTNNGGSPANSGAPANVQSPDTPAMLELGVDCGEKVKSGRWDECQVEQVCAMIKAYNESPHPKVKAKPSPSHPASDYPQLTGAAKAAHQIAHRAYNKSISDFNKSFNSLVDAKGKDAPEVADQFHSKCQHAKWADPQKGNGAIPVPRQRIGGMNPDHAHPAGLGGPLVGGALKWADADVNQTVGPAMDKHDPATQPGGVKAHSSCNCD